VRRTSAVAILALLAAACTDSTAPASRASLAPLVDVPLNFATQPVPNEYIVVLGQGTTDVHAAAARARAAGGAVITEWEHALKGFAMQGGASQLAAVRADPDVAYVEPVQQYSIDATVVQAGATWGLDRIDSRTGTNGSYTYNSSAGAGVTAYIIDTGIRSSHTEFGGRAVGGFTAVSDGNGTNDCNGHGTHVAGTLGGGTYGVAKAVNLVAVRVLDCAGSGTTTGVISGVNWVTANHAPRAVANMSLGGGASTALDDAVNNSVASGVTYVVAAGNSGKPACNASPARAVNALTVGATDTQDRRASWSNWGSCLDIFAPGVSITSAWNTNNTATNTISGTSMASPHVAGAAALYLSFQVGATPAQVAAALTGNATAGVVGNAKTGSPNRLLYTGFMNTP
jgi:subtilisin family serine protease